MRRTLISIAVTVTGLTLLTGCGGTGTDTGTGTPAATEPAAAGGLSDEAAKRQEAEKMIADCMKEKGFQYEVVPPIETRSRSADFTGAASLLKTDEELRQYRQKYGFGIYSAQLYPDDPMVKLPDVNPDANPNNKIREGLDPARQQAWDAAFSSDPKAGRTEPGCSDLAYEKYLGSADPDVQAEEARAYEQYRTDPDVVKAAHEYGDCLRGKGYKVASTEPGLIDNGVYDLINAPMMNGEPVSAAEAKTRLAEEITASLADLDCRGDYATIARTEYASIVTRGGGVG
ncbi:hypothetical protein [Catenuloplanes indicus]|uniref:Lipoprotein n=1 Tax=Catenuloplanes indicus TaxID=137267 RepID=A0AAE3W1J9_9ACTN|nr:hypothetical protein [Catenuloplanes indicus]MDQ0367625.1 hypothetical protein [Catenuloplanes indicus]